MFIQNKISKEFFGYEICPHPHYIRAMVKRLQGGNYLECLNAFYQSSLKFILEKKKRNLISEDEMRKEIEDALKTSIDRTRRLFPAGVDLNAESEYLGKSNDTVYLEQLAVVEELIKTNREKYIFMGGLNLNTIADLIEIDVLKLDDVQVPDLEYIRKIWEKEKKKYTLNEKD